MKKTRRILLTTWIALLIGVTGLSAYAQPTTSPSAKMAARLKYHPPKNYLSHYLGDDRYKIAGGVWKVVSTDLDTYYHRPNCPNMLRQPARIVIGFASAGDAEEGGYTACSACLPQARVVTYIAKSPGQRSRTRTATRATRTRNTGRQSGNSIRPDASGNWTLPASQVPKHIRSFIALVDGLSDRIEGASTGNIGVIKRAIDILINDMRKGVAGPYTGNGSSNDDTVMMLAVLQTLRNAANGKSASLSSVSPLLRNSPGAYRTLLSSARSQARDLIPQVKAWRKTQPKPDPVGDLAKYEAGVLRGGIRPGRTRR